jgi:transcriptional regulator with XRE-family HTH domain
MLNNIEKVCRQKGKSVRFVAAHTYLTENYVEQIFRKHKRPSIDFVHDLADLLGCRPSDLYTPLKELKPRKPNSTKHEKSLDQKRVERKSQDRHGLRKRPGNHTVNVNIGTRVQEAQEKEISRQVKTAVKIPDYSRKIPVSNAPVLQPEPQRISWFMKVKTMFGFKI